MFIIETCIGEFFYTNGLYSIYIVKFSSTKVVSRILLDMFKITIEYLATYYYLNNYFQLGAARGGLKS